MFDRLEWKNWETYFFVQEFRDVIENDIEEGMYEEKFKEFECKMSRGYFGFFEIGEWVIELIESTFDPYSSDDSHQDYILSAFVNNIDKYKIGEIIYYKMLEYDGQITQVEEAKS